MEGANNMPNWISVKERLPEESGAYLVVVHTEARDYTVILFYSKNKKAFYEQSHLFQIGWEIEDVTHWMPLPDPPEEVTS